MVNGNLKGTKERGAEVEFCSNIEEIDYDASASSNR